MGNLKKIQQSQKDPVDTKEKKVDKTALDLKLEQQKFVELVGDNAGHQVKLPPDAHIRK